MAADLYVEWLGLPVGPRPPDMYELLRLPPFCDDTPRIERAVRDQMCRLHPYQTHPQRDKAAACHRMLTEVTRAYVALIDTQRKQTYDQELAQRLGTALPQRAVPPIQPPAAPLPGGPRKSVVERHMAARVALQGAQREGRAGAFGDLVYAHLWRWRLGPDEELLLVAEAAAYGISPDAARRIIRGVTVKWQEDYRRSLRPVKWTVGIGAAVVAACLLLYAGIELWRAHAERAADREVAAALRLAPTDLDQALAGLKRARDLDPYRESQFSQAEDECRLARYQAIIEVANQAIGQHDWSAASRSIKEAEAFLQDYPATHGMSELPADVRERLYTVAAGEVQALLDSSEKSRRDRDWAGSRQEFDKAAALIRAAGLPAARVRLDRDAQLRTIAQAEQEDWDQLARVFQQQVKTGEIAAARETLAQAGRFHRQKAAAGDWPAQLTQREAWLAQLDAQLANLRATAQYAEAQWLIAESDLSVPLRAARLAQVAAAQRAQWGTLAAHALEFAGRSDNKYAEVGICRTLLLAGVEGALRADLEDVLSTASVAVPGAEQITRTERCRDAGERLDGALGRSEHFLALDLAGQVALTCEPDKAADELQQRRSALEACIAAVAALCPDCAGAGTQPCAVCQGKGRVPGERSCAECKGRGARECQNCFGKLEARCKASGCDNGYVEVQEWEDTNGIFRQKVMKRIPCQACKGRGMVRCTVPHLDDGLVKCKSCQGTGSKHGAENCAECQGKRTVRCPACNGTARRKAPAP